MLDLFAVFTRGGALLWTLQFTALRHSPVEALNTLIRSCLLEERSGDSTFTFVPKAGAHQAMKWTFHNGLGLVFVAVYQKALSLMYVDELLGAAKAEFVANHYKANVFAFPGFTEPFQRLLRECESRAEQAKKGSATGGSVAGGSARSGGAAQANGKAGKGAQANGSASKGAAAGGKGGKGTAAAAGTSEDDGGDEAGPETDGRASGSGEEDGATAFDLSKLSKGGAKGPRGRPGTRGGAPPGLPKPSAAAADAGSGKKDTEEKKREKKARNWNVLKGGAEPSKLDFSADGPDYPVGGSESEGPGASDAEAVAAGLGVSRMDVEEEVEDDVVEALDEDELLAGAKGSAQSAAAKPRGLLGSFMSSLAMRVVGKTSLSAEDIAPALADMKRKLMERNVAEGIAQNVCDSVGRSLEGQKLASFTGVGAFVRRAFEDALAGILHKRTVDMLLDIRKAQERGKPYVVVFCGVNGVGKSTNLAKIAYWLGQHGIKVLIAACDTFRAGAVEQLKTHCVRLGVPLYERGYEKDPAKVAAEAIKQAEREGRHVVLVDTAGRMQDNEPLMRALSNLINVNTPNLVLFVGEALVGNDAVDQLVKFNRALHDLAPPTATHRHVIDGIVLTKFDTIDDKVGAAVSMVYASGAPIMFLGCGQTYADLKRLNVKAVVNSLLK